MTERAELFYRKLMNVLDDHGRFFSNPISILGAAYPLRPGVTIDDVNRWLSECETGGLLMFYRDRKYIQVFDFRQQIRRSSKFPELSENELLIKSKAESKQNLSLGGGGGGGGGGGVEIDKGIKIFNDIEARLGDLFQRPAGSVSAYIEQSAISEISRRPNVMDELSEIEVFHRKPENFFPQSLQKLLSTWQETLDRSRTHDSRKQNHANNSKPNPRNAGVVGDLAENARQTAAFVLRQNEARRFKNEAV